MKFRHLLALFALIAFFADFSFWKLSFAMAILISIFVGSFAIFWYVKQNYNENEGL